MNSFGSMRPLGKRLGDLGPHSSHAVVSSNNGRVESIASIPPFDIRIEPFENSGHIPTVESFISPLDDLNPLPRHRLLRQPSRPQRLSMIEKGARARNLVSAKVADERPSRSDR